MRTSPVLIALAATVVGLAMGSSSPAAARSAQRLPGAHDGSPPAWALAAFARGHSGDGTDGGVAGFARTWNAYRNFARLWTDQDSSSRRGWADASRWRRFHRHPHPPGKPPGQKPTCDGRKATIVGTDGPDVIRGTPGRDVIVGLGGDDEIHGDGQDDIICGGEGNDLIYGDAGNDKILGDGGGDLLDGGHGNDTIDGGGDQNDGAVFFDATGPIKANLVTGTATGDGNDSFTGVNQLHGGPYNDTFMGSDGDNGLFGNGGNDSLVGGGGNDGLSGGTGDDTIEGGGQRFDNVSFWDATGSVTASLVSGTSSGGGEGNDTFTGVSGFNGGSYADTLIGNDADNFISGAGGDDSLTGAGGNDFLDGGAGNDTMDAGGQQFDAIVFFDETGPVTASLVSSTATGDGSDTFTGAAQLHGGDYSDTFYGSDGDNGLFGNGGNDSLVGGGGNDGLSGGTGDDTIDGGGQQFDNVSFWDATGSVTASLVSGTSSGGGEGNDTFTGVSGFNGGSYADTLIGNDADNFISGAGGDDSLTGAGGNDFLDGGAGNDTIDAGGQQNDAIAFFDAPGPVTASLATGTSSGDGNDTFTGAHQLFGGNYDDTLYGDASDNNLTGNGGNDVMFGGDGSDNLNGGLGDDAMDGGGQFDVVSFYDETGPVTASLATGTATGEGNDTFTGVNGLSGGPYGDTLVGDGGDNYLGGQDGNDTLFGGDGNDYVDPGFGDDAIDGGPGPFDTVSYFNATVPIVGSLATGAATGEGSDTFTKIEQLQGGQANDVLAGGPDQGSVNGNGGDDTITGGPGTDFLYGNDGDDTIGGGTGSDFLLGGPGDDSMDGGPGDGDQVAYWNSTGPIKASLASGTATGEGFDTFTNVEQLQGSPYDDTLIGGSADTWIMGNGGNDTIVGGSGNEFLWGNAGDDTISGGPGDDFLAPGPGIDTLDGGPGFDKAAYWDESGPVVASLVTATGTGDGLDTYTNIEGIHGGNFGDTLYGDAAQNELFGNDGNDTLYGGAEADVLNGGNGDDALFGEAGNDYIDGADGNDSADGGPDYDYCVNAETVVNCEAP